MDKNTKTASLQLQVLRLGLKYSRILENLGNSQFIEKRPTLALKHVLKRVSHEQPRNRMHLTVKLCKEEGFNKNCKAFMPELVKEAKQIDGREAAEGFTTGLISDSDSDLDRKAGAAKPGRGNRNRQNKKGNSGGGSSAESKGDGDCKQTLSTKQNRPDCLNLKRDQKHFMNNCIKTSEEDKKRLIVEFQQSKKAAEVSKGKTAKGYKPKGKDGDVGAIGSAVIEENSHIFSASLCDGAVEAIVLADQGSNINVISPRLLEPMMKTKKGLEVSQLHETQEYGNACINAEPLCCSRRLTGSVMLRIRHGTNMMMRGIDWLISDTDKKYPIIGRKVLSATGIGNSGLIHATAMMKFRTYLMF